MTLGRRHSPPTLLTTLATCALGLAALGAGGCIGSNTSRCGSAVCPEGADCATVGGQKQCVLGWQRTRCAEEGLVDGERCDGLEAAGYHCLEGFCVRGACGDGVVDTDEACDDGGANDDAVANACRTTCRRPKCGDGVVDIAYFEECDEGDANSEAPEATCRTNCQMAYCGDGRRDPAREVCDDGNNVPGDGCSHDCHGQCGNGQIDDPSEWCDVAPPTGTSCFDFGFDGGAVGCSAYCTPDLSGCAQIGWRSRLIGPAGMVWRGVWGSGPSDVWIAGDGGAVSSWDGTRWSDVAPPGAGALHGVWGSGGGEVWVIGEGATAYRYAGPGWTSHPTGHAGVCHQLWGSAANDVWGACDQGQLVHWDGAAWSVTAPAAVDLYGIWGSGPDDVWAVGDAGTVLHRDAGGWSQYGSTPGTGADLRAVWGSGPDDVWLAGDEAWHKGATVLFTVASAGGPFTGIWGSGQGEVWFGHADGAMRHYDGARWDVVPKRTGDRVLALWGSGPGDVYGVGEAARVFHYRGSAWALADAVPAVSARGDIWGSSSTNVWIAANNGVYRDDGSGWVDLSPPGLVGARAVAVAGPSAVWVAGEAGELHAYDGAGWTTVRVPDLNFGREYFGLWAAGPGDCFSVNEDAAVEHFTGGAGGGGLGGYNRGGLWGVAGHVFSISLPGLSSPDSAIRHWDGVDTTTTTVAVSRLRGLGGSSPTDVWAVGAGIVHYDGTAWTVRPSPGSGLNDVWAASADEAWAVGHNGTILHYEGDGWHPVASGLVGELNGVWGVGPHVWFLGIDGTVLHLIHSAPWR